jgi:hypothetical protein
LAWIPVTSVATVDVSYALGTEFKADSVSGSIDDSTIPTRVAAPRSRRRREVPLSQLPYRGDRRRRDRSQHVPAIVAFAREHAQMVRGIDEDQAKLETSTEAEVSSAAVHQIASVSTGIPNVLLESNLLVN